MSKLNELFSINKEISEAQDKLSGIMTAINRDRLDGEKLSEKNKELEKTNVELTNNLEKLVKDKNLVVKKLDSKIDNLYLLSSDLEKETGEKTKFLNSLREAIEGETLVYNKNKKEHEEDLNKIINLGQKQCTEIEEKVVKLNSEIESGSKQIKDINDQIEKNNTIISLRNKEIKELDLSISNKNKEIEDKNNLLTNITKEGLTLIQQSKDQLVDLQKKMIESKKELDSITQQIITSKTELEVVSGELENFVKDKMSLAKEREDLNQKEESIKYLYEQAGVKF